MPKDVIFAALMGLDTGPGVSILGLGFCHWGWSPDSGAGVLLLGWGPILVLGSTHQSQGVAAGLWGWIWGWGCRC